MKEWSFTLFLDGIKYLIIRMYLVKIKIERFWLKIQNKIKIDQVYSAVMCLKGL